MEIKAFMRKEISGLLWSNQILQTSAWKPFPFVLAGTSAESAKKNQEYIREFEESFWLPEMVLPEEFVRVRIRNHLKKLYFQKYPWKRNSDYKFRLGRQSWISFLPRRKTSFKLRSRKWPSFH